jgi:hypothetical protein
MCRRRDHREPQAILVEEAQLNGLLFEAEHLTSPVLVIADHHLGSSTAVESLKVLRPGRALGRRGRAVKRLD